MRSSELIYGDGSTDVHLRYRQPISGSLADFNINTILNETSTQNGKILTRKDQIFKEIYISEIKFVKTLEAILNDYFKPLSKILHEDDRQIVFNNIGELKSLHENLATQIILCASDSTFDDIIIPICDVFNGFKQDLMKYYAKYLCNQKAAILRLDELILKINAIKEVVDECASNSCMGLFKLNDLIKLPIQRVLKYPLLFNELNKEIEDTHHSKTIVIRTVLSLEELSFYLNEVQRDIDQIHDSLKLSQDSYNIISKIFTYGSLIRFDVIKIRSSIDNKKRIRQAALFTKALILSSPNTADNFLLLSEYDITSFSYGNFLFKTFEIKLTNETSKDTSYVFCFENKIQMDNWVRSLEYCKETVLPRGYNHNHHLFELTNFNDDIVKCSHCGRVLFGVLFQGYKCKKCASISHSRCLFKFQECPVNAVTRNLSSSNSKSIVDHKNLQRSIELLRKNIISSTSNAPRSDKLPRKHSFETREIQNINDIDCTFEYLQKMSYFAAVDRTIAELILERIDNSKNSLKTIFLVRTSKTTQYALSIKFGFQIKHLRIFTISNIHLTATILAWIDCEKKFPSIPQMIEYYTKNSLEEAFKYLKFRLDIPHKDALPKPINYAYVLFDYDSSNKDDLDLKKGENVGILSKNFKKGDICKIINQYGLVGYVPANYLQALT